MLEKIERVDADFVDKINQLIDAVNKHEDIIRQIGEWGSSKGECLWCDTLTEFNPETPQKDPYDEQEKWVGKLCWYKLCEGDTWKVGRLEKIQENADAGYPFVFDGLCYKICEPVKPDDDIIYRGE